MDIDFEDIRTVFENSLSHSIIESPISKKKFVDYSKRREGLAIVTQMLNDKNLPSPRQIREFDTEQIKCLTRKLNEEYFSIPFGVQRNYL